MQNSNFYDVFSIIAIMYLSRLVKGYTIIANDLKSTRNILAFREFSRRQIACVSSLDNLLHSLLFLFFYTLSREETL